MQDYLNLSQNYPQAPAEPQTPKKPVSVYIFGTLLALSLIQMSRDIMSWIFGIARDYSQFYVSYQNAQSDEQKELLKEWITFSENNFYFMNMLNLVFLIAILVSLILLIIHNKAFKWIFLISAFVEIFCWFFVFRIYEYFQVKQFYGDNADFSLWDYFAIDSVTSFLDFFTWLALPIAGIIYVFISPTLKNYLNIPATPNTPNTVPPTSNNRPLNPQFNSPLNQQRNQSPNPAPNSPFNQTYPQSPNQTNNPPSYQTPNQSPTPTTANPFSSSTSNFQFPSSNSTPQNLNNTDLNNAPGKSDDKVDASFNSKNYTTPTTSSATSENNSSSNQPPVNPLNPPQNPPSNFDSNS